MNKSRRRNINTKTIRQYSRNITKFYEWVGTEVWNKSDLLSCSVGDLFVVVNYTIFDDKEELMEDILKSREKYYCCKDISYSMLLPKIVQLCCTSYPRKYKWGGMRMGTGRLKQKMASS